jgi:hypothetical protein
VNIEQRMMRVLTDNTRQQVSISEFARLFGVGRKIVDMAAQRMVADGRVLGTRSTSRGVDILQAVRALDDGHQGPG